MYIMWVLRGDKGNYVSSVDVECGCYDINDDVILVS